MDQLTSEDSTGISWDFVNALAFAPGEVWYGPWATAESRAMGGARVA